VSTSSSQTLPFSLSKAIPTVNFEEVLNTPSYVTNLDDFLNEDDYLKALLYWLEKHEITAQIKTTNSITHAINRSIAEIDELINEQLNVIIHNEKLQKLEASWRGLWYLAVQAEGALNILIKANFFKKSIAKNMEHRAENLMVF